MSNKKSEGSKNNFNIDLQKENQLDTNTIDIQMNDNLFLFVDLNDSSRSNISLTGKPKIAFLDIIKRFCKNYVALISFFIVLIIAFIGLIAPLASQYSATKPASNESIDWISNLPPSYKPVVTEIVSNSIFEQIQSVDRKTPNLNIIQSATPLGGEYMVTYNKYDFVANLSPNSKQLHTILGTNNVGIDIWTRTWVATRDSLLLAFLVATTDAIIGITVGAILGFNAGKWIDTVFSRVIDVIINIPTLIWFLMLITVVSTINPFTLYLILISIGWVYMVNQTRLWIITVKDQEFILAAQVIGASKKRQIFVHALPTIIGKLSTNYVRRIVIVIISLSSLTFLGFLPTTGSPNLGTLLQEARIQFENNAWTLVLPSIILLLFSLSAQFIANGLHDALDPQVVRGR